MIFATEASNKGLVISSKSVVVAGNIALARRISVGLSRAGFRVSAQQRAEDLGVGVRPGKCATFALQKRLALGLKRADRAAILRQVAGPQAGKLFVTGVRPQ